MQTMFLAKTTDVQTTRNRPRWINILKNKINSKLLWGFSLIIIILAVLCALFPGLIAPYPPMQMNTASILKAPSLSHLFGTDHFGRDILSLIVYGSRQSLIVGVSSVLIGGIVGTSIGAVAGYVGGVTETVLMRVIEVLMTIPHVLLALAISAALGASLVNLVMAVGIAVIPVYARVMRSQVLSLKNRPFIDAAVAIGTPHWLLFFRHILPNCFSPLLVMATIGVGTSILIASSLSFLGVGSTKIVPDWGTLLSQGRNYLTVAWWVATFPGLAITLLVISVNIAGDEFRHLIDPKKDRI